jgi:7-cyano-7-deazaguanine reductase
LRDEEKNFCYDYAEIQHLWDSIITSGDSREGKMTKMTQKTDLHNLTLLGRKVRPVKRLETFPNHHPGRNYTITLKTDEFTCVCPKTGQPDFAKLTIQYIPDRKIVESKSLKLYLWSYRSQGVFHEHGVNAILDDLVAALNPRWCKVTGEFAVRGGIAITVEAEYGGQEETGKRAKGERGKGKSA